MEHETISRALYLSLVQDGMRVDRLRELLETLQAESKQVDMATRRLIKKIVKRIETAMMDTPEQLVKLQIKEERIHWEENRLLMKEQRRLLNVPNE
jgi:hypothetical protein